jgi:hypothetical protein
MRTVPVQLTVIVKESQLQLWAYLSPTGHLKVTRYANAGRVKGPKIIAAAGLAAALG